MRGVDGADGSVCQRGPGWSYSIKRLEPLCGYDRRVDLAEATVSLIALEAALEDATAATDGERHRVVAGYYEDDCRVTLALREWLEVRLTFEQMSVRR